MNVTVKSATPAALVNMNLLWSDSCPDCVCNLPHTHQAHFAAIERELAQLQREKNEGELESPHDLGPELFSWKAFFETMDEAPAPDTNGDITADDVKVLRTLATAQSLSCRITQRLDGDRLWEIEPHSGTPVICFDLPAVRAWLRNYAQCGRYGRRCTNVLSTLVPNTVSTHLHRAQKSKV